MMSQELRGRNPFYETLLSLSGGTVEKQQTLVRLVGFVIEPGNRNVN
jgi:hypothetical protein